MKCSLSRRRPSPIWAGLIPLVASVAWAGGHAAYFLSRIELPPCAFKALTGFPCAACGTTRAVTALLGGSIGAAVRFQPFATALGIGAVLGLSILSLAKAAGADLRLELSDVEKTALRFTSVYLLFVNWLYLIDTGI